MIKSYRLLIFDWDGTLADSEASITGAMQKAIEEFAEEPRTLDELRNVIGLGLDEAIVFLYPEMEKEDRQKLANRYRETYVLTSVGAANLFPKVRGTLKHFYNAGYLLAVATGKSRRGLNRSLAETGLGQFFHASRCADETQSKPHPQMLLEIMELLDVEPAHTLMIGDSEYDLQMANSAGAACAAVSYGVHGIDRLLQYEPEIRLNDLGELKNWL